MSLKGNSGEQSASTALPDKSHSLHSSTSNYNLASAGASSRPMTHNTESVDGGGRILRNLKDAIEKSSSLPNLLTVVGNTPLISIQKLLHPHKFKCKIFGKCEFRNPTGSAWDRLVVNKISRAKAAGQLPDGMSLISGGNPDLCVSISWAGSVNNFPVTVLPGKSSEEAKLLLARGYGAHVVLSYKHDPASVNTTSSLQSNIADVETTSGIRHYPILPFPVAESTQIYYDTMVHELTGQLAGSSVDMVVCPGEDKGMVYALGRKFYHEADDKSPIIVGVDLKANSFTEVTTDDSKRDGGENGNGETIKWVSVTNAESYDMARRLVREEGLMVGPVSGAVVSAALKSIQEYGLDQTETATVLVILPDNLMNTSRDFLSAEWMIKKKYYNPSHMESMYWWYEMALENISPPVLMIVPPNVPVRKIWSAMADANTQRAVVAENKAVFGIVTYDILTQHLNKVHEENIVIKDVCHKKFGIIDSKASFRELDILLQKYHWVINVHRVTFYDAGNERPQISEEIIGIINLADFMYYKRTIEGHHLSAYGMTMSDGIPSPQWFDSFKEHVEKPPLTELPPHDRLSDEEPSLLTTVIPCTSASFTSSILEEK